MFLPTLIFFSKIYSPVFKFNTDPGEALSIAFLKVSKPGSTVIFAAFIIGAMISTFQPGPALSFNAFGSFFESKLKAPALNTCLAVFVMSFS